MSKEASPILVKVVLGNEIWNIGKINLPVRPKTVLRRKKKSKNKLNAEVINEKYDYRQTCTFKMAIQNIIIGNRKIVCKHGPYCWNLGAVVYYIHQNSKNDCWLWRFFCGEDFDAVLSIFHFYDYGANASEAVTKIRWKGLSQMLLECCSLHIQSISILIKVENVSY